jgi:hypothetical protein
MKRLMIAITIALATVARSEAQIAGAGATAGSASHQVRAAGMPLYDGTLPPGIMTVRVVQGGFSNDLPDQAVTVTVLGGRTEVQHTGSDGRATFGHLPIGSRVRAWAVVSGDRLESDLFEMPTESGVRVLLIAGGAGVEAATSWPIVTSTASPASAVASVTPMRPSTDDSSIADQRLRIIRAFWITLTMVSVGYVARPRRMLWSRPRPREHDNGDGEHSAGSRQRR